MGLPQRARLAGRVLARVLSRCTAVLSTVAVLATPAQAQEEKITLWHSMGARNGEALNVLVNRFNEKNRGKIRVEAIFQGPYGDSLAKLRASIQSKQLPELVQVNEIASRLIYDLKISVPFQDVAKQSGLDIGELLPGIAAYYTVDGKLLSMPFNASAPMLFYNRTAFKAAGLDPDKPPTTLQEVRAAAERLVVRSGNTTTRYGFVAAVDGWLIEQFFARANLEYCNNGNGRDALATAVSWNHPEVRSIFAWWGVMMRDGVGLNAGRLNNDAISAFTSGRAAMLIFTSANMRNIISESKFEVGVADYPAPSPGKNSQVLNGGASIWLMKGHPPARQAAAAKFAAYLGSAEAQATWAVQTGYIAVNKKAAELPEFKEAVAKTPAFARPAQQLAGVASTPASRGCFMGVMPQARTKINDLLEAMILGKSNAEGVLAEGTTAMEPMIKAYNRAIGK